MKLYKKLAALMLSAVAVATIATTTAFAEPGDNVNDPQTSVDTPADNPAQSTPEENPPVESVEPAPPADITSDVNENNGSNNTNTNTGNNNYYQNNQSVYNNYDNSRVTSVVDRDNDYYQPGTMDSDSSQPLIDNKLYNASLANDSQEMNADDWNLALKLDEGSGGSDFNFIKNNDSSEDSVLYQLMLFGGVLLITISIFGVILVIVLTVRTSKHNKLLIAKASREQIVDISEFETLLKPARNDANTHEIESAKTDNGASEDIIDLDSDRLDLSKYDKYL